MPRVVHNLKRLFKKQEGHEIPPFKQFNYLNSLSEPEILNLLSFAEQFHFFGAIPALARKRVLLVSAPAAGQLLAPLMEQGPERLLHYLHEPKTAADAKFAGREDYIAMKGELKPLPLKTDSVDVVLLPFASLYRKPVSAVFAELTRPLVSAGRLLISVVHPVLEYFLYNQNPSSSAKVTLNLKDYVGLLRANNLYLENLTEAYIDADTKPFFIQSDDPSHYEELKGIPLVLFLRCVKFVKG